MISSTALGKTQGNFVKKSFEILIKVFLLRLMVMTRMENSFRAAEFETLLHLTISFTYTEEIEILLFFPTLFSALQIAIHFLRVNSSLMSQHLETF